MFLPDNKTEKFLAANGYKKIAGLDEAGRGSWAGPIVAAAVILPIRLEQPVKSCVRIRDSKKLNSSQRESAYEWIIKNCRSFSVAVISEKIIDKVGMGKANIFSLKDAVSNLKIRPDFLLVDGFKFKHEKIHCRSVISGDNKIFSVAAASIIAKVTRDRLMKKYHRRYPQYRFDLHKGYGTELHKKMIKKHGLCKLHRKSYRPIMAFDAEKSVIQ
ncbi:ribonuclease HII [Candidatus Parcubacteria bacterium]|nr:MAG: ribonuclease HII [Candidatus Parcubacteria bacterium]